jgi:hypothetical protein
MQSIPPRSAGSILARNHLPASGLAIQVEPQWLLLIRSRKENLDSTANGFPSSSA